MEHKSVTPPRIYISGPISIGDTLQNIRAAIDAAEQVWRLGGIPFVPHSHAALWHLLHPHTHTEWLHLDLIWLKHCHALWRLPGASDGAEQEVAEATRLGMPVLLSPETVTAWIQQRPSVGCGGISSHTL